MNLGFQIRGLAAALMAAAGAAAQSDRETVSARINADEASHAPSASTVQGYEDSLTATGTWADVDYADRSITYWDPQAHVTRLLDMTRAYRKPGHSLYGDASLSNAIHRALGAWTSLDPQSGNWWYNEIDTPYKLGRTLLLLGDGATAGEVAAARPMLDRSAIGGTGQNMMDEAGNVLVKGLILGSNELVTAAAHALNALLVTTTGEGIKPDFSFQQHGPQLYTGGYGAGFAEDSIFWVEMLRETPWAATPGQVEIAARYLLDGVRWVVWEKQWEFSVVGRGISRGVPGAGGLVTPFRRMTNIVPEQASAFRTFADALSSTGVYGQVLSGHAHYWWSDHSVHRRPAWFASVRMCSTRVQGSEAGNGEGLKDYYLGDGTTYFLRDGNEYRSLQPAWNWRRLPGVTCPQKTGALPVLTWSGYRGGSSFVGGVTDGTNGVAIMKLSRDGLAAKKAWFFYRDLAVCLGAGLAYTNDTSPIVTTLNQCLWRGRAVHGGAVTQALAAGTYDLTNTAWVLHDRFGYLPLDAGAGTFRLALQTQTGSWAELNNALSPSVVSQQVMSLWIDHGVKPRDGRYAYAVVAEATTSTLPALAAAPPFTILENSTQLQAVYHGEARLLQCAFQDAATCPAPDGTRIAAGARCALMAALRTNGITLFVSRPDHMTTPLTVRVSRALSGPGAVWDPVLGETRLALPMPSGNDAGAVRIFELAPLVLSPPQVSSDRGADAWVGRAALQGDLLAGALADVTVLWGPEDRGTNLGGWAGSAVLWGVTGGAFRASAGGFEPGSGYVYRCYASNELGVAWSAPRAFRTLSAPSPAELPGLALWLEAGDPMGAGAAPTNDEFVSRWADKSGQGRDALGGAASSSWPRVRAAALNGRAVLAFDGSDVLNAGSASIHDNATGLTVLVVARTSAAADKGLVAKSGWSANQREWVLHSSDFQAQEYTNVMTAGCRITFPTMTNPTVVVGRWQPAVSLEAYREGQLLGTGTVAATDLHETPTPLLLGCANNYAADRYLTGDVAEVVIFRRALAPDEMHRLGAGLAAKYDLAYAAAPRNPDADGDGLPDDWERQVSGGVASLAGGDADADGMGDDAERVAGTDPLNSASCLSLGPPVAGPGADQFILRWPAVSGRLYRVEAHALPDTPFAELWTHRAESAAGLATVRVDTATGFLRVRVSEP